jgi:hypothetical protein
VATGMIKINKKKRSKPEFTERSAIFFEVYEKGKHTGSQGFTSMQG